MQYNGDLDDTCVISFLPVTELERPVGFDSRRAFECESVVHWLTQYRATHPITGQTIVEQPIASVLHPLIINGRSDHVASTEEILMRAGGVINNSEAQPDVSSLCPFQFSMSLPTTEQEPVSGRIKLTSDMFVGIVGSIMELYDRIQKPVEYDKAIFVKDLVAIMVVVYMFYSHYPRNGPLIVVYITFIFLIFWQIIKAYDGVVVTTSFFVDIHLFAVLFYTAKLVLDLTDIAMGSRLV